MQPLRSDKRSDLLIGRTWLLDGDRLGQVAGLVDISADLDLCFGVLNNKGTAVAVPLGVIDSWI